MRFYIREKLWWLINVILLQIKESAVGSIWLTKQGITLWINSATPMLLLSIEIWICPHIYPPSSFTMRLILTSQEQTKFGYRLYWRISFTSAWKKNEKHYYRKECASFRGWKHPQKRLRYGLRGVWKQYHLRGGTCFRSYRKSCWYRWMLCLYAKRWFRYGYQAFAPSGVEQCGEAVCSFGSRSGASV